MESRTMERRNNLRWMCKEDYDGKGRLVAIKMLLWW